MRNYKSTSLADQVFDKLENDIIQGVYARGELLTELKLVEQLESAAPPSGRLCADWSRSGSLRTPVREAASWASRWRIWRTS